MTPNDVPQEPPSKKRTAKQVLLFIAGLAVFSGIVYLGGVRGIEKNLDPQILPLVFSFVFFFLVFAVGAVRWGYIVNTLEKRKICSYFRYFSYFVSGAFTGQYISKAGGDFLVRPALLKKNEDASYKTGVIGVFIEKAIDLLFIFVLLIPAVLYFFNLFNAELTLITVAFLQITIFFFFIYKNRWTVKLIKRMLRGFLRLSKKIPLVKRVIKESFFEKVDKLDGFTLLQRKSLLNLFIHTAFRYILLILRLYFLTQALRLQLPFIVLFLGIPVAQMSLLFSFTPGALGILEGGWYVVFSLTGHLQNEMSTFFVGQRGYWMIFTGIIFIISYILSAALKQRKPNNHT